MEQRFVSGKIISLLLAALLAAAGFLGSLPIFAQEAVDIIVSPTGNDNTGNGTLQSPFKTLERARDAVRSLKANGMKKDITVGLLEGTYFLSETAILTNQDSGENGFQVIYKSLNGPGKAKLSGATPLTGWEAAGGGIYKTKLANKIYTLYENGKRAYSARYPNRANRTDFPLSQENYLVSCNDGTAPEVVESQTVFQYREGDLPAQVINALEQNSAELSAVTWSGGYWDWFTETTPIASADLVKHTITLREPVRYALFQAKYANYGSRYYLQGALAFLDQPGEFYYDSKAGELYYWPYNEESLTNGGISAPILRELITIAGESPEKMAQNIVFDGLAFEGTDFTDWYRYAYLGTNGSGEGHKYAGYDRQIEMKEHRTGQLLLTNTNHITVTNCHFQNAGYNGVYMLFHNYENQVTNSLFENMGYSGIRLEGGYPGEGDNLHSNLIQNNLIHDVGELVGHGAGVYLMNTSRNQVLNCEIYNSPRYGVMWGAYASAPNEHIYTRDNTIKYIKVYDCAQDSGDTAPIYCFGFSTENGVPNANLVDQVIVDQTYATLATNDKPPYAVYADAASYGQLFRNILVQNMDNVPMSNNGNMVTLENVSWKDGFDPTQIEYGSIGLLDTFPYLPDALTVQAQGYKVNNTTRAIWGVEQDAAVDSFLARLTPPAGFSMQVLQEDQKTVRTGSIKNGDYLALYDESNAFKKFYTIWKAYETPADNGYTINDTFDNNEENRQMAGWNFTSKDTPNFSWWQLNEEEGNTYLTVQTGPRENEARRSFVPQSGVVTVEGQVKVKTTDASYRLFYVEDDQGHDIAQIMTDKNRLRIKDGATVKTFRDYTLLDNTWCTLKLVLNTKSRTYDAYVNDVLMAEGYAFCEEGSNVASFYCMPRKAEGDATGWMAVDDVRVYTDALTPKHTSVFEGEHQIEALSDITVPGSLSLVSDIIYRGEAAKNVTVIAAYGAQNRTQVVKEAVELTSPGTALTQELTANSRPNSLCWLVWNSLEEMQPAVKPLVRLVSEDVCWQK